MSLLLSSSVSIKQKARNHIFHFPKTASITHVSKTKTPRQTRRQTHPSLTEELSLSYSLLFTHTTTIYKYQQTQNVVSYRSGEFLAGERHFSDFLFSNGAQRFLNLQHQRVTHTGSLPQASRRCSERGHRRRQRNSGAPGPRSQRHEHRVSSVAVRPFLQQLDLQRQSPPEDELAIADLSPENVRT